MFNTHKFTRNNIDRFIDGLTWRDCCQTRLLIVTCSSRCPKVVTCLSIKNALHWDTSFSDPFHAYKNHAVSKLMHWLWPPASNNICFFVAFTIVWALASNKVDEVPFQQNRNCFAFSSACCTHVRNTRSPGITLTTWLMVSVDETVSNKIIDCNLKFHASKGHDMSFNEKHITLRYLLLSSFPRV